VISNEFIIIMDNIAVKLRFQLHKAVVRQQICGEVTGFIVATSVVHLYMQQWKKLLRSIYICQGYCKDDR